MSDANAQPGLYTYTAARIREDEESPGPLWGCLLGGSSLLLVLVVLVIAGRRRT